MGYECKILLDSISETGKRLTTFQITFPRIVLSEFNTHRMFSRNSASSRAIPFKKQIDRVSGDPFIPEKFPLNVKGMQPQEYIDENDGRHETYRSLWLEARRQAVTIAEQLNDSHNLHKQIVNRLLEPFMWHTVICTATEFSNFFKLRTHPDAQYEIKRIADLMYEAYHAFDNEWINPSEKILGLKDINNFIQNRRGIYPEEKQLTWTAIKPQKLKVGEWHCPLISEEDGVLIENYITRNIENVRIEFRLTSDTIQGEMFYKKKANIELQKRISVARCARVSYLTHEGKRDIEKDLELFEKLRTSGHWSPFEHVATPYIGDFNSLSGLDLGPNGKAVYYNEIGDQEGNIWCANFLGWKQFRKEFQDENCTNFIREN